MSNQMFSNETKKSPHDLTSALRRERVQLMIQLNLGKMELRDERLAFKRKLDEASDEANESLQQIGRQIADTDNRLKATD